MILDYERSIQERKKKQENKNIDFSAGHGTQEVNRTTLKIPHEVLTLIILIFFLFALMFFHLLEGHRRKGGNSCGVKCFVSK